jgi:hypothetical protein
LEPVLNAEKAALDEKEACFGKGSCGDTKPPIPNISSLFSSARLRSAASACLLLFKVGIGRELIMRVGRPESAL